MRNGKRLGAAVGLLAAAVLLGAGPAVAALPQGGEAVELDPAQLTTTIDNPYFPLVPGDVFVYRETDGRTVERVRVAVSERTRLIANGVRARVVHDRVSEHGEVVEDTFDWYAQDAEGNVWYLGEDTVECSGGRVRSAHGSFEAGVDGAQPGVIMPGAPTVGLAYREEYLPGEAEDEAQVLSTSERVTAPYGSFRSAVMTRNLNPLEPRISEYKLYAPGVGLVLALKTSGGAGREELIRLRHGREVDLPRRGERCSA